MKRIGIISLALTLLTVSIYAMEQQDTPRITIIDQNSETENTLPVIDNAIVSLFGATPRYSLFRHYKEVLENHLKQVYDLYITELTNKKDPTKLRLKGVSQTIKPVIMQLKRLVTLDELPEENQYALFLTYGMNNALLQENVGKLFNLASKMKESFPQRYRALGIDDPHQYLIHIMMPCYFDDCAHYLKSGSLTYEMLHKFLVSCALFYKGLYQKLIHTSETVQIVIIIPPMKYFKEIIEQANTKASLTLEEKEQSIVDLVKAEYLDKLQGNILYTLINADVPEVISLATRFYKQGISRERMGPVPLVLYAGGSQTPCFHPYTLKREKEYSKGGESFIIGSHLLSYFK